MTQNVAMVTAVA